MKEKVEPSRAMAFGFKRPAELGHEFGRIARDRLRGPDRLSETAADLRARAEEGAERLGVDLTFVVARGDPYTELKRVADQVRADAVVVGASTKAGHRWIGSLAVRLVRAGRWPVTVVP